MISLYPLSHRYDEDVYEYGRDPEFCRHIGARPFASLGEASVFVEGMISDTASRKRHYWFIKHDKDKKVIGTIGFIFTWGRSPGRPFEIGYGVSRAYWGTGVFHAALNELIVEAKRRRTHKLIAITNGNQRPFMARAGEERLHPRRPHTGLLRQR